MAPMVLTAGSAPIDLTRQALARGEVAAAEQLCRALIEENPAQALVWALLAQTALLRGRPDAAKVCAERAVALDPGDPICCAMQAKVLLVLGELVAALGATERAAQCANTTPQADDAIAALLGQFGQHQRALAFSRRALLHSPGQAHCLASLAATERMLGMFEQAEVHCDQAIAREPGHARAHYIRSDLRVQRPERNHIAEMEAIVAGGLLDEPASVLLRFALAKECEDVGAHGRAFAHVQAGAALQRRLVDYNLRAEIAGIEQLIARQAGGTVKASARAGAGEAPIFVCGLPRTGTTLVERIIASHSAVGSVGECAVFPVEAARTLAAGGAGEAGEWQRLGERYVHTVREVWAPRERRFVDKTLQNYLYCGLIHAALPQAKLIVMVRGAMDTAWALYKAHFQHGFGFSYALPDLAAYYLAYRRLVDHWRATLPEGVILTVRYEDLVRNPREQSGRLLHFLGLPWEESTLGFHNSPAPSATASAVQVRSPMYATSIGKWRSYERSLAPFREHLGNRLPSSEVD